MRLVLKTWNLVAPASKQQEERLRNKYDIEVRAQCPVNRNDTDLYAFTIESQTLIEVEKIAAFFAANAGQNNVFQEVLTQQCAVTLGAKVTSIGWHSGIKVTSEAP
jgi:hypothetical protein